MKNPPYDVLEYFYPGVLGSMLAFLYSAGPYPLKYNALGDLTILVCFGPCIVWYASLVFVREFNAEAIVFTLPVAAYTIAILHANNVRDIANDSKANATTVAIKLGEDASLKYYDALLQLCAHGAILAVGTYYECVGVACTLWVLPLSLWLCSRIRRTDRKYLLDQDEKTAKCQMLFGLTLCIGVASMPQKEFSQTAFWISGIATAILHVLG